MYSKLGFSIVTAELDLETSEFIADLPWHPFRRKDRSI
jgi:hypothetical protein